MKVEGMDNIDDESGVQGSESLSSYFITDSFYGYILVLPGGVILSRNIIRKYGPRLTTIIELCMYCTYSYSPENTIICIYVVYSVHIMCSFTVHIITMERIRVEEESRLSGGNSWY